MIGSRSKISPIEAGIESSSTPRVLAANDERTSSSFPRAYWAASVGIAAVAMDWAMAACGISIKIKAKVTPVTLPSCISEARRILTQKLSCTTATPSRRGPIRRITSRTGAILRPKVGEYAPPCLSRVGICKMRCAAAPMTAPQARPSIPIRGDNTKTPKIMPI